MNIYDLERMQEVGAWVGSIEALPHLELSGVLITKAQELAAAEQPEHRRTFLQSAVQRILSPKPPEKNVSQSAEEGLSAETPEIDEQFQNWLAFEADMNRANALSLFDQISRLLDEVELGLAFEESLRGTPWIEADTMDRIRYATKLQNELGVPVFNDRLRSLIVRGINSPHNGCAARMLIQLAVRDRDDYKSFLAAGRKYDAAVEEQADTGGCEQWLITCAADFVEAHASYGVDTAALRIALNSLRHYDPVIGGRPILLARLGVALQHGASNSVKTDGEVVE